MTDPRPAPYPADTRAKGWRFELDYEQIEQSGTWAAAMTAALDGLPLARPFLLAMWYAAWKQVPCGSMPADDRELAGAIGIPSSVFAEYRELLMRGWWLAEDGRLYHDTVAQRVLEMIEYRRKEAARKAGNRGRPTDGRGSPADVPRDTDGTDGGEARDSTASHDTGTGTGTTQQDKPVVRAARGSRKCPAAFEPIDPKTWIDANCPGLDWQRETAKFRDHTFKNAITDWPGTWRNWMRRAFEDRPARPGAAVVPLRQQSIEDHNRRVGEEWERQQDARDAAH